MLHVSRSPKLQQLRSLSAAPHPSFMEILTRQGSSITGILPSLSAMAPVAFQSKAITQCERNLCDKSGSCREIDSALSRLLSVFGRMLLCQQNGSCHDPSRRSTKNGSKEGSNQLVCRSHNWATEMGDPNDVSCNGPQNAKPNSFFATPDPITCQPMWLNYRASHDKSDTPEHVA